MGQDAKKYIAGFIAVAVVISLAFYVYVGQLKQSVTDNIVLSMEEISEHDAHSVEASAKVAFSRMESLRNRLAQRDIQTIDQLLAELNLEMTVSAAFDNVYLLDEQGNLYTDGGKIKGPDDHTYDEYMPATVDHYVASYDDSLENPGDSLGSVIYAVSVDGLTVEGVHFTTLISRYNIATIEGQLSIKSFDGEGCSSVFTNDGSYIVPPLETNLPDANNFYEAIEDAQFDDGMSLEDIQQKVVNDEQFTVACTMPDGERIMLSFAPVTNTGWMIVMSLPSEVFDASFNLYVTMAVIMLVVIGAAALFLMLLIGHLMRRNAAEAARAEAHSAFLSKMSHEIRTPLNGIIGLREVMVNHVDEPELMREYLRKMGDASQYLLSLINDVLDATKIQAGKNELVRRPFNLPHVVEELCHMHQETTAKQGIAFTCTQDIEHPNLVGDEMRIKQVMINILSNAAKFTSEGGRIDFTVRQEPSELPSMTTTVLSVSDTGCGMSREFVDRIFDMFSQDREQGEGSLKGTGLGMPISRMLVEQMGGEIKVESEKGAGSCFTVVLPLPVCDEAPAPAIEAASVGAKDPAPALADLDPAVVEERACNILVAEDNPLNAEILVTLLEENGLSCTQASNGEEALAAFAASESGSFDAILMDVQMPVMDGYEATQAIRALDRPDARTVRIFACTASTFQGDIDRARECGMDDFLAKPLNMKDILRKLKDL